MIHCLTNSDWADENLAEYARHLGKMVEHPIESQPNPCPDYFCHPVPCSIFLLRLFVFWDPVCPKPNRLSNTLCRALDLPHVRYFDEAFSKGWLTPMDSLASFVEHLLSLDAEQGFIRSQNV